MRSLVAGILVATAVPCSGMELVETSGVLTVQDGERNVLSFRFADQLKEGVDPKYTRSCYIHPLYTLEGEVLTEDFPADHFHHRGVYFGWPVVKTRSVRSETWHPHPIPLRQVFRKWAERTADVSSATIVAENDWLLSGTEVVARDQMWIHVHPLREGVRAVDVSLRLEAVGGPLTLQGTAEGKKGYGGFCLRGAPWLKGATLTSDRGTEEKDLENQPRKWLDLTGKKGGVALFVPPGHPGFPPAWLARNSYAGFLNVSWPGLTEITLQPGEPVTLRYRLLVHRTEAAQPNLEAAYAAYAGEQK